MDERHNCYALIDEALKEKGVRLSMNFRFNMQTGATLATPRIPVEVLEDATPKQKRAAKHLNMLATNCPFCGVLLPREP